MDIQKVSAWKVAKGIAGILGVLIVGLLTWGIAIEPRIIHEKFEEAQIPRLPARWEGKTIAFIADIQLGMWLDNEGTARRIVQRIVTEHPAVVLLGGDFIYHPTDEETAGQAREELDLDDWRVIQQNIARIVALLRPLVQAGLPTYAVLGNHDYLVAERGNLPSYRTADALSLALEKAGIIVLRNQAIVLQSDSAAPLYLAGVDSLWAHRADPEQALAQLPMKAPRIWLLHNPDVFEQLPAYSAPIAVAGHTHGGQVRIPGFPHWSWLSLVQKDRVTADGWIQNYGQPGNHLYVNIGIGFSHFPIRIDCPPELTWLTLQKASKGQ